MHTENGMILKMPSGLGHLRDGRWRCRWDRRYALLCRYCLQAVLAELAGDVLVPERALFARERRLTWANRSQKRS